MIEAVIALPVLALLLLSVPYVHSLLAARLGSATELRMSAWSTAASGCDGDGAAVPATSSAFPAPEVDALVEHPSAYPSVLDIPVLGDALTAFSPRALHLVSNRDVQRPKVLMSEDAEQDAIETDITLSCNETAQDPGAAALRAFLSFIP